MSCFDTETTETLLYYRRFAAGDESALTWIVGRVHKPLVLAGKQLISDEFVVKTIVQESILKSWELRHRITSLQHLYRFMRLNVKWQCYSWYKKPVNRFHRNVVYSEFIENYADDFYEQEPEPPNKVDKENWRIIQKALPCLPAGRQAVMLLYFKHGVTYKKIARRFGVSASSVSEEVKESLQFLKKITHAPAEPAITTRPALQHQQQLPAAMDAEMQQVFKLRYEQKQSFASIAEQMNLPQSYVQLQYVAAHEMINALKLIPGHKQSGYPAKT